jgi:hypothetical protein
MASSINHSLNLPRAKPAPFSKYHSKFGFYCYSDDGRFCFHNFHSAYAAKHFLEFIMQGKDWRWIKENEIVVENGTRIRGERVDDLERALTHKFTSDEAKYEIPEPDLTYYRSFLGLSRIKALPDERPPVTRAPTPPEVKVKRKKEKIKAGAYVTIGDIAQELRRKPSELRGILRKLKIPKPETGNWAWPPSEAERIKSKLRAQLK